MRLFLLNIVALSLIGCAQSGTQTDAAKPIVFEVTGPQAAQAFDRLDRIRVRTFTRQGLRRSEVTGLSCTATGTGLRATFTSPATLAAPTYRGRTDPITISCTRRLETTQTVSRQITPVNTTKDNLDSGLRIGVSSNDGVNIRLGVSIRDKTRDRFDYPATALIDFPG
ncbi:MAG: hypothetical protein AAGF88_13650 [Pseudomonadota bacterium]